MKTLLTPAILLLVVALTSASVADVITVDGGGGGDYLTIPEAVDAASAGDTVLVYPGTYTDIHNGWWCGESSNVCICQPLTLRSLSGPDVTVIDAGGLTMFGILSEDTGDVFVEGFTVRNAGWYGEGAAICVTDGEVRGNVCTGSSVGISDYTWWCAGSASEESKARGRGRVVADNILEGNEAGIILHYGGTVTDNTVEGNVGGIYVGGDALVSGNIVTGGELGVGVNGPLGMSIIGNEISGNTKGITVRNPSRSGRPYALDLQSNRIADNTETNIEIKLWVVEPGAECDITLGGSVGGANDIYGAPVNMYVKAVNVELRLDATYNFWGSVACSTFVPLFDIHEDFPDTGLVFEPFVDETHIKVFEECEGVPVEQQSWGRVKALFR